jgi:hypothetical protein
MATVEGSVVEIYQTEDYAWVQIEDAGSTTTKVIVYSDFVEDYPPHTRVVHGNWLAMARTAMTSGTTVLAYYQDALLLGLYMRS